MNDNELDALLAPPALTQPANLDGDLAALVSESRAVAQRSRRSRRIIAGTATLALTVGGATAAAAGGGTFLWEPEFENADSSLTYMLPSGTVCEVRTLIEGGEPETVAAAERIIATPGFADEVVIGEYLSHESAEQSEDRRYLSAYTGAVQWLVIEELDQAGYSLSAFGIGSQSECGIVLE